MQLGSREPGGGEKWRKTCRQSMWSWSTPLFVCGCRFAGMFGWRESHLIALHEIGFLAKQIASLSQCKIIIYRGTEEVLVCMVMSGLERANRAEETGGLMDAWISVWPSGLLSPRYLIPFSTGSVCKCAQSISVIESNCYPERTPSLSCICGDMSPALFQTWLKSLRWC